MAAVLTSGPHTVKRSVRSALGKSCATFDSRGDGFWQGGACPESIDNATCLHVEIFECFDAFGGDSFEEEVYEPLLRLERRNFAEALKGLTVGQPSVPCSYINASAHSIFYIDDFKVDDHFHGHEKHRSVSWVTIGVYSLSATHECEGVGVFFSDPFVGGVRNEIRQVPGFQVVEGAISRESDFCLATNAPHVVYQLYKTLSGHRRVPSAAEQAQLLRRPVRRGIIHELRHRGWWTAFVLPVRPDPPADDHVAAEERPAEERTDHDSTEIEYRTPHVKQLLQLAHNNLGHPDITSFTRVLRFGRCRPGLVRWVRRFFEFPTCKRRRPPLPPITSSVRTC